MQHAAPPASRGTVRTSVVQRADAKNAKNGLFTTEDTENTELYRARGHAVKIKNQIIQFEPRNIARRNTSVFSVCSVVNNSDLRVFAVKSKA